MGAELAALPLAPARSVPATSRRGLHSSSVRAKRPPLNPRVSATKPIADWSSRSGLMACPAPNQLCLIARRDSQSHAKIHVRSQRSKLPCSQPNLISRLHSDLPSQPFATELDPSIGLRVL